MIPLLGISNCIRVTDPSCNTVTGNRSSRESKVFISAGMSLLLEFLVQFFCFMVDYTRIENVQFEDDDYYYYVKAVLDTAIHF